MITLEELNKQKILSKLKTVYERFLKDIKYIRSWKGYESIEDYFLNNMEEIENYKEFSYQVLVAFAKDSLNYDSCYRVIIDDKHIELEELLEFLKDKEFTLKYIFEDLYYTTLKVPEFNVEILYCYDD